jgi:hypothetical protein
MTVTSSPDCDSRAASKPPIPPAPTTQILIKLVPSILFLWPGSREGGRYNRLPALSNSENCVLSGERLRRDTGKKDKLEKDK